MKRITKIEMNFVKKYWKMAHFDSNCMAIGILLLKILRFYVFKMAASRGHHFEIKILIENYRTQFISQK